MRSYFQRNIAAALQSENSHAAGTVCRCTRCALCGGHNTHSASPCARRHHEFTKRLARASVHLEQAEGDRAPVCLRVLARTAVVAPYPSMTCRDVDPERGAAERKEALHEQLAGLTGRLQHIHTAGMKLVLRYYGIPAALFNQKEEYVQKRGVENTWKRE
jgi:hypothetical protein